MAQTIAASGATCIPDVASTLEIGVMKLTGRSIGGAPVLPELLEQIPADEKIASASDDGADDTKDYHKAIASRAAHVIIPVRTLALGKRTAALLTRVTKSCARRAGWVGRSGEHILESFA